MTDNDDAFGKLLTSGRLRATCVLTAAEDAPIIAKRIATAVREERERVLVEVESELQRAADGSGYDVLQAFERIAHKLRSEP